MTDSPAPLPRHGRWFRVIGGTALIAAGCAAFAVSKALDPQNRGAIAGILGVIFGCTYLGQGLRGHHGGSSLTGRQEGRPRVSLAPGTAALGVVLGWIVPGLGHWIAGLRTKALVYFFVITLTFVAGVALAQGRNLDYQRDWLYFLAYGWNAGATALGWLLTRHLEVDHVIPTLQVGYLYSAVAGLLNVVAVMDFVACCADRKSHGEAPA